MNDGTAFVLFLVCLDIVKSGEFKIGDAIVQFVQLSFGGPGIGLVFGIFAVLWIRVIVRDTVLGVMITFFAVYLCFFVAESVLHVSGILALVVLGFFLGTYGKVRMGEDMIHALHTVWNFIAWALETLLFMITGMYIGHRIKSLSFDSEAHTIVLSDLWKVPLFYVMLMLIRFLVTVSMWPL